MPIKEKSLIQQKEICKKYNSKWVESKLEYKVGISKDFDKNKYPINGLRHPIKGDTTGWYIWSGENFLDDVDFFQPVHMKHLNDVCPEIMKYLGLAPGYRFLFGEDGYIDIWKDKTLLDI